MALEFGLDTFGDITAGADGRLLPHAQVIRNIVEEAVLAEGVGLDVFGIGEHHRADFAVSCPEMVLATIAGRTQRIRLSSSTTVLSADDPVRVFERFATLDAASIGRAEIILGRGWFTEPFALFGYELADYETLFDEKLGLFAALIRHDGVTWRGTKRPPLTKQRLFPPLEGKPLRTWVAVGSTPQSVLRAAQHELPMVLAVIGGEPHRFRPFVDLYRLAFERLGKPMQAIGAHSTGYVATDDAQAREELWNAYQPLRDRLGAERGWPPIARSTFEAEADRGSVYVGSPETVARKIVRTARELSLSRFNMKYSVGTLSHEKLMRSIELYGSKVVPKVRDMLA